MKLQGSKWGFAKFQGWLNWQIRNYRGPFATFSEVRGSNCNLTPPVTIFGDLHRISAGKSIQSSKLNTKVQIWSSLHEEHVGGFSFYDGCVWWPENPSEVRRWRVILTFRLARFRAPTHDLKTWIDSSSNALPNGTNQSSPESTNKKYPISN